MTIKASEWIGRQFGRLTVTGVQRIRGFRTAVLCKCECGFNGPFMPHNLVKGNTTSCGCLWKERITTHGKTKSRAYIIWKAMKYRCSNPNAHEYHNYGGRGISVCPEWEANFEVFYADMGEPPTNKHTLERKDNDKGYSPDNCIWATYKVQLNNRRNNIRVTAFGRTQTLTQWAEEYGLAPTTLKNRLFRAKMKPEDALTAPMWAQQRRKRS